jgi:hypothetical protein
MAGIPLQRFVFMDNARTISSYKPFFSGQYATLDEIRARLAAIIPAHPNLTFEFYNKQLGAVGRKRLDGGCDDADTILPADLEDVHVYMRSNKQAVCATCVSACGSDGSGGSGSDGSGGNNNTHM